MRYLGYFFSKVQQIKTKEVPLMVFKIISGSSDFILIFYILMQLMQKYSNKYG
jgi:hypothetical protein